jgi:phenylalanyl-tRNA synthetase beta chain
MKVSEQWLREWVELKGDTAEIAEQMTMAGLEVDGIRAAGVAGDKIVVGRVTSIVTHPNADKLRICSVDTGGKEALSIVCGAANVAEGQLYPVALIGAELPGGLKIKHSKLRGEDSFGMLCSAAELGLAESASGLLELPDGMVPGANISSALNLNDQIIDIDLTPNRADCFSMLGVARDMAAFNDLPLAEHEVAATKATITDQLPIGIDAKDGCGVFAGRIIRNINPAAESPFWLKERLRRAGVRALHPVVDITNYVMLEYGQPMHGYDLAKLDGAISARWAANKEKIVLLDEQQVELSDDVLVIANAGEPVAIAGIMGGASTAVTDTTTDIFLESAWFAPAALAGRARRFGLHTEASMRFERGVDFKGQLRAIERATELLLEIVGGEPGPATEQRINKALPEIKPVSLRKTRLTQVMGLELPDNEIDSMLKRLGFKVAGSKQGWEVTPTSYRFDIQIEADLIEEVIRLYGYGAVPAKPQQAVVELAPRSETAIDMQRILSVLIDRGYHEVITYSFVDPGVQQGVAPGADLALANPLSRDLSVMRRSLWPGLLEALSVNAKRQQDRLRLFEHGVIFESQGTEIKEVKKIAGLAWGPRLPESWKGAREGADLFDIKSDLIALLAPTGRAEHFRFVARAHDALCPGRSATIELEGVTVGWLGELHPSLCRKQDLATAPVVFEISTDTCLHGRVPTYRQISRFPSVRRDLAVIVDAKLAVQELVDATRETAGPLLKDIIVFDIFAGKGIETGLKSVALGLILQETSRTLTEPEIDGVMAAVMAEVSAKFNASIRE